MYQELLPIGSVVLLKGGNKRVMICGRVLTEEDSSDIHDYVACYYPEGIIDPSKMFFFDRDAIEAVFFIGFQDAEELQFRATVLAALGDHPRVEDGRIVPGDDQ